MKFDAITSPASWSESSLSLPFQILLSREMFLDCAVHTKVISPFSSLISRHAFAHAMTNLSSRCRSAFPGARRMDSSNQCPTLLKMRVMCVMLGAFAAASFLAHAECRNSSGVTRCSTSCSISASCSANSVASHSQMSALFSSLASPGCARHSGDVWANACCCSHSFVSCATWIPTFRTAPSCVSFTFSRNLSRSPETFSSGYTSQM